MSNFMLQVKLKPESLCNIGLGYGTGMESNHEKYHKDFSIFINSKLRGNNLLSQIDLS